MLCIVDIYLKELCNTIIKPVYGNVSLKACYRWFIAPHKHFIVWQLYVLWLTGSECACTLSGSDACNITKEIGGQIKNNFYNGQVEIPLPQRFQPDYW